MPRQGQKKQQLSDLWPQNYENPVPKTNQNKNRQKKKHRERHLIVASFVPGAASGAARMTRRPSASTTTPLPPPLHLCLYHYTSVKQCGGSR